MAIYEHIAEFAERPVVDFEAGKPIRPGGAVAYRLSIDYDTYSSAPAPTSAREPVTGLWQRVQGLFGKSTAPEPAPQEEGSAFARLWRTFLADPNSGTVEALVFADWGGAGEGNGAEEVVSALVAAKSQLPALTAVFVGEMVMEESEISWIQQSDLSPIATAYPGLTHLQVRGSEGLALGTLALPELETLILESGGLPAGIVEQVCASDLPALRHLELWLGSDEYGGTTALDDLVPILSGEAFPALRCLGLRNCEFADELAAAVAQAPVLERLEALDLSLGNMSDEGAKALLAAPLPPSLTRLDLHHHYFSNEVMAELARLPVEVDVSEQQEADEYDGEAHRYIAVSE